MTRFDLMLPATSMARHSRVNLSITVNRVSFANSGFSTSPFVVAEVSKAGVFGPTTAIVVGPYQQGRSKRHRNPAANPCSTTRRLK
jgi:hypothetical protein